MIFSANTNAMITASRERAAAIDVGRVSPNPVAIVKVKKIDSLSPNQRRMDHRNGHFYSESPGCNAVESGGRCAVPPDYAKFHPGCAHLDSLSEPSKP